MVLLHKLVLSSCLLLMSLIFIDSANAAAESNIRNTKHNLSANSGNTLSADTETQICVFCHTPHGATSGAAPLWNRELNTNSSYTMYDSLSFDARGEIANTPGGSSKLCLSCHDGTIAIGKVNVSNGVVNPNIVMQGTAGDGTMRAGSGTSSGYTRDLGVNLSNDHPISFTFNTDLANADGELRDPATATYTENAQTKTLIGDRLPGDHPLIPTENGQVQCTSCHDPHIWDPTDTNRKFLRANRLQKNTPATGGNFNPDNDQICIACHDKNKMGNAWGLSAHANSSTANETYSDAAATLREFPLGTKVWQAGCLNCHDTHTVNNSRRLLRAGTDHAADGITAPKLSGSSAIEQTCYQCHRPQAQSALTSSFNSVPDIYSDFNDAGNIHMPISNSDQNKTEIHNITDGDFIEDRGKLGLTNPLNRHVECTDCHNPHRVMKAKKFNASVIDNSADGGTHNHGAGHTNIASGALKGSIGVEPDYGSDTTFDTNPVTADARIAYIVKKGVGTSEAVTAPHVTREYQVCLRCHSDYGFGTQPPQLGQMGGGTTKGTNGVDNLTNQAMEFQAPTSHQGEGTGTGGWASNNHRSWHPVMRPTRRTQGGDSRWNAPWKDRGNQTMYCSDCHGNKTNADTTTPKTGQPWGPHGSSNNFILKGQWDPTSISTSGGDNQTLCFRCHSTIYLNNENDSNTGFVHGTHNKRIDAADTNRCTKCHVALPHGWKNKAFLVNLNDVGPECDGMAEGTNVNDSDHPAYFSGAGNNYFTCPPYYSKAVMRIKSWSQSGSWGESDCGVAGGSGGTGWMKNTCQD
ncbi:hypothetical protein A9Q98_08590 [Thalassotalea sp. 42_200_T64]|nr:hypothetical protein A9Q98_08590 [Thalassotalea sp. 42_200_T64]